MWPVGLSGGGRIQRDARVHGEGQSQGLFADNTRFGALCGGPLRGFIPYGKHPTAPVSAMLGMQARGVKVKGGGHERLSP